MAVMSRERWNKATTFDQYVQRSDTLTLGAGNAKAINTVTHMINPWPPYVMDRRIPGNGERMVGAVERYRLEDDEGSVVVAQLAIGEADFWIQEDIDSRQASRDPRPVRMILTVADPDTVFERAIAAGATEVFAVSEEHGWRIGRIADPFGHYWEIGKPLR